MSFISYIQNLFFIVLLLLAISAHSQLPNTQLIVNIPNVHAAVFVNGAHGTDVNAAATIDSLPSGDCLIDVSLLDSASTHLRMNVFLIEGQSYLLQLSRSEDSFYATFGLSGQPGSYIDVQVFESPNTNCALPCTLQRFDEFNNQIRALLFERQRLQSMKRNVPEYCLTTDQIGALALNLDDESYRLDFLIFAYEFCFDQRNFIRLESSIVLERNKLKFLNKVD